MLCLFVLIWVSLNCRQAIQIRHYLLDWWFRHSPTAEAQPLVSHSSPKLPLYGNLSLHLTQYQQMWSHTDACLHSWKATNPDTPVTGTHCVLDPRLPYLDDATGATSWYSSKFFSTQDRLSMGVFQSHPNHRCKPYLISSLAGWRDQGFAKHTWVSPVLSFHE